VVGQTARGKERGEEMSGAVAGRRRAVMLSTRFPSLRENRVLFLSCILSYLFSYSYILILFARARGEITT